ncbi:hypothetical protein GGI18_000019 [Coemansia linderi]|uniref:Uncharacterized protein n=1 Tax=Coemansia linderi TaxID=2663919 RepID=A0ACC1KPG7_9FUNG|nr:hypothetical protein GGI18_000019 [Coemansia linderi]
MKSLGILGALVLALSSTQLSEAHGSSSYPRAIRPKLAGGQKFTVYDTPIALSVGSNAINPAVPVDTKNKVEIIGTAIIDKLSSENNIPPSNIRVTSAYADTASGITHIYLVQTVDGKDVTNSVANVNVDASNRIISLSHSFAPAGSLVSAAKVDSTSLESSDTAKDALSILATHIGISLTKVELEAATHTTVNNIISGQPQLVVEGLPTAFAIDGTAKVNTEYIQQSDGSVVPVWRVVVEQKDHWWNAHIDVSSQKVISLSDWYAQSESYFVYAKDTLSPADGSRKMVVDPAYASASPKGWVSDDTTSGNNVWAQSNPFGSSTWKTNHRPTAQSGGVFNYTIDFTKAPKTYIDAAITQLFYSNNIMHDLSYIYGFDEAAGNFQDENYSGEGVGGDYVVAFAQDGGGTNNANFATPPDGENPRMRMYIWTQTRPNRDGDLEQDIVAHEFTHGISNRLTGGPANTDCLNDGEAGGMGEGWSDAVANILRLKSTDTSHTDFILGDYVYNKSIRKYPYSTSLTTNPSTYSFLDSPEYEEVHDIGEVWAEMLYEVMWALINKNGFAKDIFAHDLTKGNSIMLQILLDGMKLQPCNPTFIDARDAIIQAENNLTGGKNKCAIWTAFAKRGLGVNAPRPEEGSHTDDHTVPSGC